MILKEIGKFFQLLLGIPKTLYFNFKYLPLKQAIIFPVIVSPRVHFKSSKGRVILNNPKFAQVKLGYGSDDFIVGADANSVWDVKGTVTFDGYAEIGPGFKLLVTGDVHFGNYFSLTGKSSILCADKITFGKNNLIGWDIVIMDHDFHQIKDAITHQIINEPKPIVFNHNIWVGYGTTILKGVEVAPGCVVAAKSTITKSCQVSNSIFAGEQGKLIKENIEWER